MMKEPPEGVRNTTPMTDYQLGYYRFPRECPVCEDVDVWPMGATASQMGNRRECWSCGHNWVEG